MIVYTDKICLNFSKFSLKDLRALLKRSNKPYSVLYATKGKKKVANK